MAPNDAPPRATASEQTVSQRIVETLKREIIDGTLSSEDIIIEAQVAARFGLSKTPAREALLRLGAMGLVSAIPGRGYTITKLSWKQVKDLYELRWALEATAAELAAQRAGPALLAELKESADRPLQSGLSLEELLECNYDFHRTIWRATRNDRLVDILSQVMDDLTRAMRTAMYLEDVDELVEQHNELVRQIALQDSLGARQAMQEHIRLTQRRLLG